MNADSGFDRVELRQICKDKEIEANIDTRNRKIQKGQSIEYQYFDEWFYKR